MRILIGLLTIASLNATSIGVMAADSRSNSHSDRLPIDTLIAKGGLPKKAGHTKASSQLRGFKPQKIQVGKKTFYLNSQKLNPHNLQN